METITPDEIEYLAEREPIRIIPNFTLGKMYLISGDIGPFQAGLPVQVPIWVALGLKQQVKCRIVPPDWLDINVLERIKQSELESTTFTKMPSEHYMVIAKLLFQCCSVDIPNASVLKTLVKDIWDIRTSKLSTSVKNYLGSENTYAKVDNVTMLELATIRPFFQHALEQIYRVKKTFNVAMASVAAAEAAAAAHSNSMSMSMSMNTSMSSNSETQ